MITDNITRLNNYPNAKLLIYNYCRGIGSQLSDEELFDWIDKILSIGDPLCILEDEKIIAFLLLYCNKYDTLEAYICNVYVLEDCRGRGLSKILVDYAISICSARHFNVVNLDVACDNLPAIRTYQKCFFKESQEYLKDGEHFYKMSRVI